MQIKLMFVEKDGGSDYSARFDKEILEFLSLGVVINKNDLCRKEVKNSVAQRRKVGDAITVLEGKV